VITMFSVDCGGCPRVGRVEYDALGYAYDRDI